MPLRLLIIEDSPTDARLIAQNLRQAGHAIEFERVDTREAVGAAFDRQTWDVVTCDWSMPNFTALEALGILKRRQLDLPFIIVSGTIDEEVAVGAMRAGAHDFVLKDRLARLAPAVEREVREAQERAAHRQLESSLHRSEARFQRLSDAGVLGIALADMQGHVFDANEAFLRMLGYTREELPGLNWSELTPSEFRPLVERAAEQLRISGAAPPWETEHLRKDGSRVPLLIGVAMLDYPNTIAFVVDLSERRKAEQEAHQEQLARTQAEAALHLSEEQFRQAQKMEAVGRLAGGVAHDFNNVLTVILGYVDLILSDLKPADPLRTDLEEIHKAGIRAAGLTRQLLLFSRQQVSEPRVVDLNQVLANIHRMLERILGEDVELVSFTAQGLGKVWVDPNHVEQVVLNLVVNARDAMPQGGKLTLETANMLLDESYGNGHLGVAPGPYVMLAVTDTGCGMDKATRERIFEPFFTTKEKGQGTGLGLSTVFGIVQQSGGHVWVYSEPGRGTTFKIYFPQVDAEVDTTRPAGTPANLRGTETILLVEDEEQVRVVVQNILQKQGYRILGAQNAGEALLLCEQHQDRIDLLLTDVVMPQMSGPELARRLGAVRPDMKILCMSGYTDDAVVRHGLIDGSIPLVQKPITPGALAEKVRQVLDSP